MIKNNYDLNGFYALNKYKDNDLVKSKYYIYFLDTCIFKPIFNYIYQNISLNNKNILITRPPGTCILIFSHKFIELYNKNFDINVSKQDGLYIEHGINIKKNNDIINSYYNYQKCIFYQNINVGYYDIYMNGISRYNKYYPFLGVNKFIFLNMNGDITDDITNNIDRMNKDMVKYNLRRGIKLMNQYRKTNFK